ncbi:MAG: NADP oxidoreductase [Candidatus Lokiarchaeota archaeon]|nr:NADP oxidoreductase [Candidatus Lokiarchaeota archaeon]
MIEKVQRSFGLAKDRLEGSKDSYGRLIREIVNTGVCTHCGACVATCDVLEWVDGKPKLTGKCTGCGVCYNQCPRTLTVEVDLIGDYLSSYTAKASNERIEGQDGGVVTAIIEFLLDTGLIDSAIVTQKDEKNPWKPKPSIVKNKEELYKSSGSIYSHSQTVVKLVEAIKEGDNSIAFVGTPCNIDAIHKMKDSPTGLLNLFMRANIIKIGLFCMDSFNYESLRSFMASKGIDINKIQKMTIQKGKFTFISEDGETWAYPVHDLDIAKSSSCNYCIDLTSENADISVGSVGSPSGWSTVLIRTGIGEEIFNEAVKNGYIELRDKAPSMKSVLFLAKLKKVELYTVKKRRTFVIRYISEEGVEEKEFKEEKAEKEVVLEESVAKLKAAKMSRPKLIDDFQKIKFTLTNTSGRSLEDVTVNISHVSEFFETASYDDKINVWYPFEELEFQFPRVDNDQEYLVRVIDKNNRVMTKSIDINKVLEKAKKKK